MEHASADPLLARRRVLITGARGQLGHALAEAFADDEPIGVDLPECDISRPLDLDAEWDLILHAAAWTDVDGAEADPQGAAAVNIGGTRNVAALAGPLVYFSTDYVFDGRKGTPYVESDGPTPISAYGRSKLAGEAVVGAGAWIVRLQATFGPTSHNFVRTMLKLGGERDEVSVVDDQVVAPTYVGHVAAAVRELVRLPFGVYHLAADGECSWREFAEAIFEEAQIDCRVVPITSDQLGRLAPRPAYSVLRSEKPETPRLPHWREGLRACLERLL
ncbi:MAG: dTDP-4-dehydrorhamnose reductase [Gaiellaceae bacterium]